MTDVEEIVKHLKIKFKNKTLINQAFIHRSYLNEAKEKISSNERLEFLGDCILSFLVSRYLYLQYPLLPEGELTNLRSSVVKTSTLAAIAQKMNLGKYLKLSRGEEESQGRSNPSILADTFEAFLGAVYLDSGLPSVETILNEYLFIMIPIIYKEKSYKDAKSTFQEMVQGTNKLSPLYKVISEKGPDHAKEFTIGAYVHSVLWGIGLGKNKQEAEQKAALSAIEKWKEKLYNKAS